MKQLFLLAAVLCLAACDQLPIGQRTPEDVAQRWADAYFNYDFKEARRLSTDESEQWLRFAASNVTQQDLDLLAGQQATVQVTAVEQYADSVATAAVEVTGYLRPDSIGRAGSRQATGTYRLRLVQREGKWRVRMEGLPRSEKQSRGQGADV